MKANNNDFIPDEIEECPSGCKGHGICYDKKCYCELGYTGDKC